MNHNDRNNHGKRPYPQELEQAFSQALGHQARGEVAQALALYQTLAKAIPDHSVILNNLGMVLYQSGQPQEAVTTWNRILRKEPDNVAALLNLGTARLEHGNPSDAASSFRTALRHQPDNVVALNNLGNALKAMRLFPEAEKYYRLALALSPRQPEVLSNLGGVLKEQYRLKEAEQMCRQALQLADGHATAWHNLSGILLEMNRFAEAESASRKANALRQGDPGSMTTLGLILDRQGQIDEARELFIQVLKIQPNHPLALDRAVFYCDRATRFDEARGMIMAALKVQADFPEAMIMLARLQEREGRPEEGLKILKRLPSGTKVPLETRSKRLFELARIQDLLHQPEAAFKSTTQANELAAQTPIAIHCDKNLVQKRVAACQECLSRAWLATWTVPVPLDPGETSPIFLMGFPRSGTTLLDQMLESHPKLTVLMEQPLISTVKAQLLRWNDRTPENLAALSPEQIRDLRQLYWQTAARILSQDGRNETTPGEAMILVDKQPLNTLEVGLIHRLFPEAKIVFSLRHPCDAVLSSFMQDFVPNHINANFFTLADSARFYDQAMRLWQTYRDLLPLDVHQIRYEDLIADTQKEVGAVLNFLNLEWDDAILNYAQHARQRNVLTPSYSQVTQGIYQHARLRWLRYREQLQPVLPILEPHITYFGYASF